MPTEKRDEIAPIAPVCPHRHRHAQRRVEYGKHNARKQPQLCITDTKSQFDGLLQNGHNLPIYVTGREDDHQ